MTPVYSKINIDDKRRIYESYVRGEDYIDAARLLNVKRTTAYNIVKRVGAEPWRNHKTSRWP